MGAFSEYEEINMKKERIYLGRQVFPASEHTQLTAAKNPFGNGSVVARYRMILFEDFQRTITMYESVAESL